MRSLTLSPAQLSLLVASLLVLATCTAIDGPTSAYAATAAGVSHRHGHRDRPRSRTGGGGSQSLQIN
jgi:hypothetical protein